MEQFLIAKRTTALLMLILPFASSSVYAFQAAEANHAAAPAHGPDSSALLKSLDELIERNKELQRQNQKLIQQIQIMRQQLAGRIDAHSDELSDPQAQAVPVSETESSPGQATENLAALDGSTQHLRGLSRDSMQLPAILHVPHLDGNAPTQPSREPGLVNLATNLPPQGAIGVDRPEKENKLWSEYTPNFGYKVANTEYGDLSVSIFTYVRYINQRALDNTFTNGFGQTSLVQQRQDVELNKLQIKFLGWALSPKFRYFLYAWTNNANQGGQFYIALAGYVGFNFNKRISLWGGLNGLPGTRSIEGNFPFWLGVDTRMIADEFFRPSYTSGVWLKGEIIKNLNYHVMVGNNLSTLGVTAAQFNQKFNTTSLAVVWTPTTGEFGQGFGDYEYHNKVATRLAFHFTRSDESKENQPNTEAFENTQIRLSDGTIIFTPNIFGPGVEVTDLRYRMSSFDGGIKYKGMALEGEYFLRWLDEFQGPGVAAVPDQFDHGFQIQASAMAVPKVLQLYVGGSKIFGNFGHPYDVRIGSNWFPFKNRVLRWNSEALYLDRSPVGYTAVPFTIGGRGWVFHTNLELAF